MPHSGKNSYAYNEDDCATITIQVPPLPQYTSRSNSRSPENSSIGSSYQGQGQTVSEPERQTIRRGSTLDSGTSDETSANKDALRHNGHMVLVAKESDASYQSQGSHCSVSDSLQLSEDLALHIPLFSKENDETSQDANDSLQLSDDFDDPTDLDHHSNQEAPLLANCKKNNLDRTVEISPKVWTSRESVTECGTYVRLETSREVEELNHLEVGLEVTEDIDIPGVHNTSNNRKPKDT